jgi:hypothetical protein
MLHDTTIDVLKNQGPCIRGSKKRKNAALVVPSFFKDMMVALSAAVDCCLFHLFRFEELTFSFNGGKDSTVPSSRDLN